jgi:hypothetical protein
VVGVGRQSEEPIELEARLQTKRRLSRTANLDAPATAKLIYDAIVKVADRMTDANKVLETKANGVIALSSALLGFGANMANAQHVVHWQFGIAAIVSLLVAIGCAFRATLVTTFDLPSPAYYNVLSIAADENNEAKIALELAESWHRYTTDERAVAKVKSTWLNRSVALMAVGLVAFATVAVDVLLATRGIAVGPTVVH